MTEKKSPFRLEYSTVQDCFHLDWVEGGLHLPNTNTYRTLDDGETSEKIQRAFPNYFRVTNYGLRPSWNEVLQAWKLFREKYWQLYPELL